MTIEAPRVGAGVPEGGRFTPGIRDEAEVALQALVEDRAAYWTPGTIHPRGGYDEVRVDDSLGATSYYLDGQLHRLDGPAEVLGDGTEIWYYEGARHRDDGLPAAVFSTGDRYWYVYGVLGREGDNPATVLEDGSQMYFQDGVLSRGGGLPAVVYQSGHTEWWVGGEPHRPREYGPAKIHTNGDEEYWEQGKRISAPKDVG